MHIPGPDLACIAKFAAFDLLSIISTKGGLNILEKNKMGFRFF